MSIQQEFPNVHYLSYGATSFVYEVHPRIVVKVRQRGEVAREQFRNEVEILKLIFSRQTLCPSIVQCYFFNDDSIFLEYMQDSSLYDRIKNNQIINEHTYTTLGIQKLEPLHLRKTWIHDLAQAAAFLESFNLAHGDLQPTNILIHRDRVKLCDFDCTAKVGENFEACIPPYARLLNSKETHLGKWGSAGRLGPRTELFALGSVYYFINYGFEVYGLSCLTEDPKEHGRKVVDWLQQMEFPILDSDEELIDDIIHKCWHNEYAKVADLAQYTKEKLLVYDGKAVEAEQHNRESERLMNQDDHLQDPGDVVDRGASKQPSDHDREADYLSLDQNQDSFPYSIEKAYCEDLVSRGLVDKLSSKQPEELGFTMEWYRYSS